MRAIINRCNQCARLFARNVSLANENKALKQKLQDVDKILGKIFAETQERKSNVRQPVQVEETTET